MGDLSSEPQPGSSGSAQAVTTPRKDRLLSGAGARLVTSLLVAAGFVWLLGRGGLPLLPERSALSRIPLWAMIAFAFAHLGSTVLRAYRWNYLLRPIAPEVKRVRVLGMGLIGFGAIFFAPLRTGEIVRPYLLARDGDVSFAQAAGTIFAERVMDGVVLTLATSLALFTATTISPLPDRLGDLPLPLATVPAAVYTATLAFCGLLAAMVAFYAARAPARRATRAVLGVFSSKVADWAANTLERLADGLSFLPSRRDLLPFLMTTVVAWLLAFVGQWLLLQGSGIHASFVQATAMLGILGIGVVVPAGPGLFGAYQIASFSALALFFPLEQVKGTGAAVVFVAYVANLASSALQLLLGTVLMVSSPAQGRA
jgi:glycosyltransferase 2 family protein